MSPHELKIDILGPNAPIARFDIFREGDIVYLVEKATGRVVETGYKLPGSP